MAEVERFQCPCHPRCQETPPAPSLECRAGARRHLEFGDATSAPCLSDVAIFNTCVSPIRSEKGQASHPFLCISISLSCESFSDKCYPPTFFGIARIPQWLFASQKRGKAVRASGGRERASVSPHSSRLYPARTVRWAPHRFRPLESSSSILPLPLGVWKSRCKDRSGVLRVRTLFLFLHFRVPFWLFPCVRILG